MYMSAVSRLVLLTTMVASACAQVDPTGTDMPDAALYYAMASAPAGPGWQAEARAQVAANVQSPLVAARIFAALGVAQYAAITDVAGAKGIGNGGRSLHEAERGAIAGASARVLSFFYPAGTAAFEERVQNEASAGPGNVHPAFTRGLAVGRAAGDWMVARIQSDGFTTPWAGTIPTGPGIFVPNGPPAGPGFGAVTPYFLTAGNQFRPDAPPAFGSPAFLADLAEIKALSDNRTPEQHAMAVQWNYPNGTYTPVGYWHELAGQLIEENRMSERAAAHVFALLGAVGMDALIGCWEAKYEYWYIRPWQATTGITLPIGAPNHPSYPSGHSCVSAAMADVLAAFFPPMAAQLTAEVSEAGLSRMYGGIHYRFDITAGEELGRATAQHALAIDREEGLLSVMR